MEMITFEVDNEDDIYISHSDIRWYDSDYKVVSMTIEYFLHGEVIDIITTDALYNETLSQYFKIPS